MFALIVTGFTLPFAAAGVAGVWGHWKSTRPVDPKAILKAVVERQTGATDVKDIQQDGHPGVEFRRTDKIGEKDAEFRQRVVMANGRMFQQMVIAEKGSDMIRGKAAPAAVALPG